MLRPLRAAFRRRGPAITTAGRRAATTGFQLRARTAAALSDGHVTFDVDPSAFVSAHVRVEVLPGTHTTVVIGAGARIEEAALLSLRGGELTIGAGSHVRRRSVLLVTGHLEIGTDVLIGIGSTIHCDEHVRIGDLTVTGENVTVTDSRHERTPAGMPVHHSLATDPVTIGTNCWLGASAVITAGVHVGDQSFVGAGAVVTKDVPAGWLVGGVPARRLRELDEIT